MNVFRQKSDNYLAFSRSMEWKEVPHLWLLLKIGNHMPLCRGKSELWKHHKRKHSLKPKHIC